MHSSTCKLAEYAELEVMGLPQPLRELHILSEYTVMRQPPGNPFRDLDRAGLAKACNQYIASLSTRRTRSAAERAQLTEDVIYLLITLTRHIE